MPKYIHYSLLVLTSTISLLYSMEKDDNNDQWDKSLELFSSFKETDDTFMSSDKSLRIPPPFPATIHNDRDALLQAMQDLRIDDAESLIMNGANIRSYDDRGHNIYVELATQRGLHGIRDLLQQHIEAKQGTEVKSSLEQPHITQDDESIRKLLVVPYCQEASKRDQLVAHVRNLRSEARKNIKVARAIRQQEVKKQLTETAQINQSFINAVITNDEQGVLSALDKGAYVDTCVGGNITALNYTIMHGYNQLAKLLVSKKAYCHDIEHPPLQYAIIAGNLPMVQFLAKHNIQSSFADSEESLLGCAALCNQIKIMQFLIDNNIDTNVNQALIEAARAGKKAACLFLGTKVTDKETLTLAFIAAGLNWHFKLLHELIEKGYVNVDICDDKTKITPLIYAAHEGDTKFVEFLLAHNANVNARDNNHNAAPLQYAVSANHTEIVKLLLDHDADIAPDPKLVKIAVVHNNKKIVKMLVNNGADVNACYDSKPIVPMLIFALIRINEDNEDIIRILIKKGAHINQLYNGHYPLYHAFVAKKFKSIHYLLENGANPNFWGEVKGCDTPLEVALASGNIEIATLLVKNGAHLNIKGKSGITPLLKATIIGNIQLITLMLERGANPNSAPDNGVTPLLIASGNENIELMTLLLNTGANPDATNAIWRGLTPLMWSIDRGNIELVTLMLEKGANPNNPSNERLTPLAMAEYHNNIELMILLLKYGANPNATDTTRKGPTLLMGAARRGDIELVKLLLEKGADSNVIFRFNKAIDFARRKGHTEIVELLNKVTTSSCLVS